MTPSIYEPAVMERVVKRRAGVLRGTLALTALATAQRRAYRRPNERHAYTSGHYDTQYQTI